MEQLGSGKASNLSASFEHFMVAATREEAQAAVNTIANFSRLASLGRRHRCPNPCPHRRRRHRRCCRHGRRHESRRRYA